MLIPVSFLNEFRKFFARKHGVRCKAGSDMHEVGIDAVEHEAIQHFPGLVRVASGVQSNGIGRMRYWKRPVVWYSLPNSSIHNSVRLSGAQASQAVINVL